MRIRENCETQEGKNAIRQEESKAARDLVAQFELEGDESLEPREVRAARVGDEPAPREVECFELGAPLGDRL